MDSFTTGNPNIRPNVMFFSPFSLIITLHTYFDVKAGWSCGFIYDDVGFSTKDDFVMNGVILNCGRYFCHSNSNIFVDNESKL